MDNKTNFKSEIIRSDINHTLMTIITQAINEATPQQITTVSTTTTISMPNQLEDKKPQQGKKRKRDDGFFIRKSKKTKENSEINNQNNFGDSEFECMEIDVEDVV